MAGSVGLKCVPHVYCLHVELTDVSQRGEPWNSSDRTRSFLWANEVRMLGWVQTGQMALEFKAWVTSLEGVKLNFFPTSIKEQWPLVNRTNIFKSSLHFGGPYGSKAESLTSEI